MDSLGSDMKGRTLQPICMSSLETTNWSRGPGWRLNSNSWLYFDAPLHTSRSPFHRGDRQRTQGFRLSSVTLLRSQKRLPLYLETHFPRRHHSKREVGQLTRNNYKHLLLRSSKTNTQTSKWTQFNVWGKRRSLVLLHLRHLLSVHQSIK